MSKIRVVVFDVDGTLVNYESSKYKSGWDAIGGSLEENLKEEWFNNLETYYPQKDKIIEWTEKDAALLRNRPLVQVEQALFPNGGIPYNPGVEEFINGLKNGYILGLVSGGINLVSNQIMNDFKGKFSFAITNVLGTKNGSLDGTVQAINMWKKDQLLENKLKEYGISLNETCYIGDSGNDIPVMKRVNLSVAFDSEGDDSEEVKEYADYVIKDFKELNNIIEDYQFCFH